jgi:hypothetical protein
MNRELKKCPVCKTLDHPKAESKGHLCKPCASDRSTKWGKENPERFFFNQIKAKYGISKEDYLNLVERQDNKCAICGEAETAPNHWKQNQPRRLAIDHCHETGIIRGLLCYRCNTTLGKVEDNPTLLRNMAAYLEGDNV